MLNNVVFLESGYHTFFCELEKCFAKSYFVSSTWAHKYVYARNMGMIFNPHPLTIDQATDEELMVAMEIQQRGWVRGSNIKSLSLEYILGAIRSAHELLLEFSADLLIMHNHQRFMHAIFSAAAEKIGIKVIVFERGLFRPFTTTIDVGGVNADASVKDQWSTSIDLLQTESFRKARTNAFDSFSTRHRFVIFYILVHMEKMFGVSPAAYLPKKPSQLIRLVTNKISRKLGFGRYPKIPTDDNFVVFALQLASDTQLLLNSPWNSNMHLLYYVNRALEELSIHNTTFICTAHPLDDTSYPDFSQLKFTRESTGSLIHHACAVLTVNSTVSIEALSQSGPICLLGQSGFNVPDIGFFENLASFLTFVSSGDGLSELQLDLRGKYLDFLMFQYQTPINVYEFSSADVITAHEKIYALTGQTEVKCN